MRRRLLRARGESGQVTVWAICISLVLFGLMALTVDVGFWLTDRRYAQNQADAAALVAGLELPSDDTVGMADIALDYLGRNGTAEVSVCALDEANGYTHLEQNVAFGDLRDGKYHKVRVCVSRQSKIFLSSLLDVAGVEIRAIAAAGAELRVAESIMTIFANCEEEQNDALKLNGQTVTVTGHVHSNCQLEVGTSPSTFDGPVTCNTAKTLNKGTYLQPGYPVCPDPEVPRDLPLPYETTWEVAYPYKLTTAGGVCTFPPKTGGDHQITTLSPGVHCFNGDIKLLGDNKTVNDVTVIATGKIEVSGNGNRFNQTIIPRWKNILFMSNSTSPDAIKLSGQGTYWTGIVYAPRGKVTFNGSDSKGNANFQNNVSIIADRVEMSGSNWDMFGFPFPSSTSEADRFLLE